MTTLNEGGARPDTGAKAAKPDVARYRPWRGPAIASGIVAAVILLLLIPNMLIYPAAQTGGAISPELMAGSNQALEERAEKLRKLLQGGVCKADGNFRLGNPQPGGATQSDLDEVLPPELNRDARSQAPQEPGAEQADADAASQNPSGLLDTIDKGVSLVVMAKGEGKASMGTGFFIAPDLVVTNAHVVDAPVGQRAQVFNKTIGNPVDAVIEATSGFGEMGNQDFALLRLQGATAPTVLKIAPTPGRTQTVVAAGFPGIIMDTDPNFQALLRGDFSHLPDASTTSGMVTHVQKQAAEVVVHSAQIAQGNSGGPLLDRCGRVTGVNTFVASFRDQSRLNYSLGANSLNDWLKQNNVNVAVDDSACKPGPSAPDEQQ
jgi:S1-C subfamily serine protease